MTDNKKLAQLLIEFTGNTVCGQITGMYRCYGNKLKDLENRNNIILFSVMDYLNLCYRECILRNDEYVVENFDAFVLCSNHSHICLLHILFSLIKSFHENIMYEKLDYSNYDNMKNSAYLQIKVMEKLCVSELENKLSHNCTGIDIKTCNPKEELFYVKYDIENKKD